MVEDFSKAELIKRISDSYLSLDTFLKELDNNKMVNSKNRDGWSIKDFVIHIAKWENGITFLLNKKKRWEGMGVAEAVFKNGANAINNELYEKHKNESPDHARLILRNANDNLMKKIDELNEEELKLPYKHYDPDSDFTEPVWGWIAGNTFGHITPHLGKMKERIAREI
jgi:hypothetical protein